MHSLCPARTVLAFVPLPSRTRVHTLKPRSIVVELPACGLQTVRLACTPGTVWNSRALLFRACPSVLGK